MEREKMIEEIARLICENEKPCYDCLKCTIYDGKICCKYLRIAKKIVNLLIPEGAVVLTKEEYERLQNVENDLKQYTVELYNRAKEAGDRIDQVDKETDKIPQKIKDFYKWFIEIEKEQVRKETAKGFATNLENHLSDIDNDFQTDDAFPEALYLMREIDKAIDETLKDFGVEVEE